MSENSVRTYQTRSSNAFDDPLSAYAAIMARVEHCLFADILKGNHPKDLKSSYLKSFGITARQFNAARVRIEGKMDSILKLLSQRIEMKKHQITVLEEEIPRLKNKEKSHQKKRRLARLKNQLNKLETDGEEKKISLCFGSKKLFRAQFDLKANGYANHEEWRSDWQKARSDEIFILGSKDETAGNQSCTATIAQDDSITLRVRLPDALFAEFGKYLLIPNIRFVFGHEAILAAIRANREYQNQGKAITFRLKKDAKGWRIFASVDIQLHRLVTKRGNGVIALDINSGHLAVAETDRFGNPIRKLTIPLNLHNTTKDQARALIGDAAAQVIALSEETRKPLVMENLDFQKKKAQLRGKGVSYSRMLSSFAYASIIAHLKGRGQAKGIEVHSVNPAYTSLIGRVKFSERYGLSIHHAAALCIGRRFLGISERMPQGRREIPDGKGGHVTLDLPVRNRLRHVWHQWGQLAKKFPAALTAHFRTVHPERETRSSNSRKSVHVIAALLDLAGETPARESSTQLLS